MVFHFSLLIEKQPKDHVVNFGDAQKIFLVIMKEGSAELHGWKHTFGMQRDLRWWKSGVIILHIIPMIKALELVTGLSICIP